jgi:hypothetical protein
MLDGLAGPREEIQPNDSLSVVGGKRRHEMLEQELARFPHEDYRSEVGSDENDASKGGWPQKRALGSTALPLDVTKT